MIYSSLTIFGEEGRQLIPHLPQDTYLSLGVLAGKFGDSLSNSWLSAQVIMQNGRAFPIVIALWRQRSTEKCDHRRITNRLRRCCCPFHEPFQCRPIIFIYRLYALIKLNNVGSIIRTKRTM